MDKATSPTSLFLRAALVGALGFAPACTDGSADESSGQDETGGDPVPSVYEFESRFVAGESSVAYSGQTMRQVLVASMVAEIDKINEEITVDGAVFTPGEVAARLNFYYTFDSETGGSLTHAVQTDPAPAQSTFDDISSDKDLQGKIAGNDEVGQHKDWSTQLVGWDGSSPDALVQAWIQELDAMAVAYSAGTIPVDPDGAQISVFYVGADGRDYQQLLEKFLLGAVNFSQGADDYLDDDEPGKGLLSDNTAAEEGKPYTALEHQWDEGFGYWGGARAYLDMGDDVVADDRYADIDMNGAIDLLSEYNFSASVNAAKRDRGSAASAPTDFSADAMEAFLEGRHIIANGSGSDGALTDDEFAALQAQRDIAVDAWEKSLAATAVHYINDTIRDLNAAEYDFLGHAKHWSELKGFLLVLQFNPRSPLNDDVFATIHAGIGTAPVLPGGDTSAYILALIDARDALGQAYGFAPANLGDELGENGW